MGEPHIFISSMMKERYIVVSGKSWVRPPKRGSDHAKTGVDRHSLSDLDQPDCNERTCNKIESRQCYLLDQLYDSSEVYRQ